MQHQYWVVGTSNIHYIQENFQFDINCKNMILTYYVTNASINKELSKIKKNFNAKLFAMNKIIAIESEYCFYVEVKQVLYEEEEYKLKCILKSFDGYVFRTEAPWRLNHKRSFRLKYYRSYILWVLSGTTVLPFTLQQYYPWPDDQLDML